MTKLTKWAHDYDDGTELEIEFKDEDALKSFQYLIAVVPGLLALIKNIVTISIKSKVRK